MDFEKELKKRAKAAEDEIFALIAMESDYPGKLPAAMRYSIQAGGKRLRPVMMKECFDLFGGGRQSIGPFMAAMECIHTASLIHDDLPAIDNDMLRRGAPTVHAKYGEAIGVLAGDAVLNYAYELIFYGIHKADNKENALKAASCICTKAGYKGMLGGQGADVEAEKIGIDMDKKELIGYIYTKKTAALFEASMMAGAILAGADKKYSRLLEETGRKLGLAFQIQDDILDITSTTEKLGKPVLSDIKNEKLTYVSLFGMKQAKEKVKRLTEEALSLIDELPGDTEFLKALLSYLALREM